jgi:ribosomal protein S18 acetylase RimI-like enzyme
MASGLLEARFGRALIPPPGPGSLFCNTERPGHSEDAMDQQDHEPFEIVAFDPTYQKDVRYVVQEILCRETGVQKDLAGETDLKDVEASYAPPDSRFLIAKILDKVVGTAGLLRVSDTDCELRHLHVLSGFRRRGIASALVGDLLNFVRERGYKRILLELRPEMKDTVQRYSRYGFAEETQDLPRPAPFMSIRL